MKQKEKTFAFYVLFYLVYAKALEFASDSQKNSRIVIRQLDL